MGGNELRLVEECFASNYIAPAGPMLARFEKTFAAYTGIPHVTSVSSGTAAIHLALRLLGIGRGDRVFFSSLTFIGGVTPALFQGAEPVFIDSDRASWTMDPHLLAEALRDAAKAGTLPKAVVPTDLYGQSCDLDAILALCAPYKIPVVVDSAEAVGGAYKGRHCGDGALMAAFSFNGNKIITTSGGGMLASHDPMLIERARFFSHQAREDRPYYEHETYGYNYRMSNVSAAIGCGQMEVLDQRVARRRAIFASYRKILSDVPGISFMPEAVYGTCNYWLTVVTIDPQAFGASCEDVRLALERENIESRPVWKPMHLQPVFKDAEMIGGAVGAELFARGLCLPSGTQMTDEDVQRVAGLVRVQAATRAPQKARA
ncbi:MAG TPA: aminotransferase class I/II-fold pyridoxal phosphate-dependent enzyme [Alphaproteobacteria bacterium]|nr:aminotransferase class I/II-fold pyridoxal phosphate-dependent enzyme [Alphaproteobacteria bacterium]